MSSSQHLFSPLTVMNLLLAGGGFSVLSISIGSLFARRKRLINYVTSALGLSFSSGVLFYLAQTLGLYRFWPGLLYLYCPLVLLSGVLLFFFFTLLVDEDFPIVSPYLLLFLPVLAATGLMLPYFLQAPAAKIAQIPIHETKDPFFRAAYFFIAGNLEPWVFGNFAIFLARTGILLRRKRIRLKPKSKGVMVFALLLFCALFFYVWVNFFPSELARKASLLALLAIVYPLYFFQQRNRELFGLSSEAQRPERYEHSKKLAGVDTAEIMAQLDRAMVEKKLYADNELSLARLSEELGISPHQLSEILNAKLGINFRQYINRFRIEAAKASLGSTPERTILEIAYECGFGSKSAFNAAFSQATGKSPREWINELNQAKADRRSQKTK